MNHLTLVERLKDEQVTGNLSRGDASIAFYNIGLLFRDMAGIAKCIQDLQGTPEYASQVKTHQKTLRSMIEEFERKLTELVCGGHAKRAIELVEKRYKPFEEKYGSLYLEAA